MANQLLASIEDINGFLPDLAEITDGDDKQLQIDANRVIKSQLSGVFPATLTVGWVTPGATPEIISGIAGRLIAAKWYNQQFSQESTAVPAFAQNLYNEAIQMLADIKRGVLIILDSSDNPINTESGLEPNQATDLYPNNIATSAVPAFSMNDDYVVT